jgi:hypothetical protein
MVVRRAGVVPDEPVQRRPTTTQGRTTPPRGAVLWFDAEMGKRLRPHGLGPACSGTLSRNALDEAGALGLHGSMGNRAPRIAEPCADRDVMTGDQRTRHCARCDLPVTTGLPSGRLARRASREPHPRRGHPLPRQPERSGARGAHRRRPAPARSARVRGTSANFTNRGQTRKIEAGVAMEDRAFVASLERQWLNLVNTGVGVRA